MFGGKMTAAALFVDLPNFYSHLLESGIEDPRFLRDYFLDWLDFDLLAEALAGSFSGIWVFYSGRRFGPRPNRIEDQYLDSYITRINSLRGVTARDVNIPGQQREQAAYKCEKCGQEGRAEWESEKGIDSSLTVHMFDTMDSWDVAYLLSGDADFVPVVASLRRRGKIVMGAGFSDASSALVRECYEYVNLPTAFLKENVAAYALLGQGRIAERWLTDELQCTTDRTDSDTELIEASIIWNEERTEEPDGMILSHRVSLMLMDTSGKLSEIDRIVDISDRRQQVSEFKAKFPNVRVATGFPGSRLGEACTFYFSPITQKDIERGLNTLASIKAVRGEPDNGRCTTALKYDPIKKGYNLAGS
jgi:hypothetical protein